MRELNIAYGNNRQAKRWVNKTIRFDDLKERLKVTIRTTESAEEYAKMSRAQRDTAKDHGGFVAGVLKGGRRKVDTVESRSMVALDGASTPLFWIAMSPSAPMPLRCTPLTAAQRRIPASGWYSR